MGGGATALTALEAALAAFAAAVPLSVAGANIAWGLVLAALLWRGRSFPRPRWRDPACLALMAYCGAALLAGLLGIDPAHSLRHLHQDLHKLWIYLLFSCALAAAPAAPVAPALAAGLGTAALVGAFQSLLSLSSIEAIWDWERAHAFVHPSTFGIQMALASLGAVCFLAASRRPRAAWALLGLFLAALLLSNTRGALLGLGAGLAALPLALPRLRRWALAGLAAAALLLACMEAARPDRSLTAELAGLRRPSYGAHSGQKMRLVLWKAALEMGRDHPLTGVGPNNYRAAFPSYFSGTLDGQARTWGTAHNLYLHQFAERGLIGLAALLALLGSLWAGALRRARARPDAWNLWALAAASGFLALNLTEVAFQTEVLWMLFFLIWLAARARDGEAARA